jgi:hypothetical protein
MNLGLLGSLMTGCMHSKPTSSYDIVYHIY